MQSSGDANGGVTNPFRILKTSSESTPDKEFVAFAANMTITSISQSKSAIKNGVKTGYAIEMSAKFEEKKIIEMNFMSKINKINCHTCCVLSKSVDIIDPNIFK